MPADYSFQVDCNKKMLSNTKGIIVLPTGSGKSRIEFNYINDITNKNKSHKIFIITAPRIILCQQLIDDFYNNFKNPIESLLFVSVGKLPKKIFDNKGEEIDLNDIAISATTISKIENRIEVAKNNKKNIYIFSTYKSFHSCMAAIKRSDKSSTIKSEIHLVADEAHYFTRAHDYEKDITIDNITKTARATPQPFNTLKKYIKLFTSRYFLTATPVIKETKESNETNIKDTIVFGSGMDNEDIYGNINFFNRCPGSLIPLNVICQPKLYKATMDSTQTIDTMKKWEGDFILKVFDKHEDEIRKACSDPKIKKILGGKLLVTIEGSKQLIRLMNYKNSQGLTFVEEARKKDITVAWTMSNKKGTFEETEEEYEIKPSIDGKTYNNKSDFLFALKNTCQEITYCNRKKIKTLNNRKLIILHYDQLTEGIDIPSMSGLLILRNMNNVKTIQNMGRTMRMHPADKNKDFSKRDSTWIKPFTHIIAPTFKNIYNETKGILDTFECDISIHTLNNSKEKNKGDGKPDEIIIKMGVRDTVHGSVHISVEREDDWVRSLKRQIANKCITNISLRKG